MDNITKHNAPKYSIGQVIDLSYKYGGLPNRILINAIFIRKQDKQWMYKILLENIDKETIMSESFIKYREINKSANIYHNNIIKQRYINGWRWCGNYEESIALNNSKIISTRNNVEGVRLYPAINYKGDFIENQYGLWVKYFNSINCKEEIDDPYIFSYNKYENKQIL